MSDKKIELIAQLLAKAESTTPEEAEALTQHAERLMVKYAIDQAVIDARRAKAGQASEKIIQVIIPFSGAYRLEFVQLGAAVVQSLGSLRALMSTYKNKSANLYIIGFESDVQQAEALIRSLQVQAMVANRAWWKEHKGEFSHYTPYDQEAARRSFVGGFGIGAAARIRDSRQQAVQEAGSGTELVLIDRDAKVQEHFEGLSTRPNRARGGKGSSMAQGHGYRAGQNANTGERAMTQGRGISA
jgi:hypothetical protein